MDLDDPLPPSLASPTLAASGSVLPHSDIESRQLADKASHHTLTTTSSRSDALPASAAQDGAAHPARTRSRACSACLSSTAGPAPLRVPCADAKASANAQHAPLVSQDHAREGDDNLMTSAGSAAADEPRRQCAQPTGARLPLVLVYASLADLPNEVLLHILGYLDVCDLLLLSRTSHQFRTLALAPILHRTRLRLVRSTLPPLLTSPQRPSLADLISRRVFLTSTTVVSRKLARSLTAIRLSRRLAVRPPPEALVARAVLPREYVHGRVAPALVASTRAVERERVKDGLRRWVGSVWERRWREVVEERRRGEERGGVGRVWRLRRFWERVGRGELEAR